MHERPKEREEDVWRALVEPLVVSSIVTGAVTAISALLPSRTIAALVGFVFLGATWALVWRLDDAHVTSSGLALGGLVLPGRIDRAHFWQSTIRAIFWALLLAAITFGPFYFGWRMFWRPRGPFSFSTAWREIASEAFGQVVLIALPEEAFYRGYLQSRIERALPSRVKMFGASVGPALLVTSAIFALGHVATVRTPARLAVFFPSLAFGWLRKRTGGIGASVLFHAMCNIFSEGLGRGYGFY
ncbi:MAG: MrtC family glutamic-type intramembrane protease [Polyangiaceae bacterium]|nr:MrtC family glutamic-type intramembrane protease [Polyangiaceae bacterium]